MVEIDEKESAYEMRLRFDKGYFEGLRYEHLKDLASLRTEIVASARPFLNDLAEKMYNDRTAMRGLWADDHSEK